MPRKEAVVPDEADHLYGLALEDFTPTRNRLARELTDAGRRDVAERVRGLRKPTRAAWALNRAVRAHPELKDEVLAATAELAAAQEKLLADGDRSRFEAALARHRDSIERLLAAVRDELGGSGAREALLDRARTTLEGIAADEELRDELTAGRLTGEGEATGFGALAGFQAPPRQPQQAASERKAARQRVQEAARAARHVGRELERAERQLERARRRLGAAEEEVAALEGDVRRLEREAARARAMADELP
jgi:chromosome segregation ATPase